MTTKLMFMYICLVVLFDLTVLCMVGLSSIDQCTPCEGGFYCPSEGMSIPTQLCEEGYFCKQYGNISAPDQSKPLHT